MLRIGASGPPARGKTTRVFRRSLGPRPKTSPYLSAAQGLKVFRFRRALFRHTASQNGCICPSWERPAMPAHVNSSLHHPSFAQVQRQHDQVGGNCRFYPASRHSPSPHQLRLRTSNLSTDPGDSYLGFLRDVRNEVALSANHSPRPHCQCVAAKFSQLGRSHSQTAPQHL